MFATLMTLVDVMSQLGPVLDQDKVQQQEKRAACLQEQADKQKNFWSSRVTWFHSWNLQTFPTSLWMSFWITSRSDWPEPLLLLHLSLSCLWPTPSWMLCNIAEPCPLPKGREEMVF